MVKTPGGRTVLHYRKRKPKAARCPITGEKLHGVPRDIPSKLGKMSKTQKRPQRPYGGVLSSRAMRELIRRQARELSN